MLILFFYLKGSLVKLTIIFSINLYENSAVNNTLTIILISKHDERWVHKKVSIAILVKVIKVTLNTGTNITIYVKII